MNPASEDIKDMLADVSSLALTFAEDLFIAKEPPSPDLCVTIFDIAGMPNQLTFDKDETYQFPSIQIRVRALDYLTGWDLANDIMNQLHGRAHETWNGTLYSLIRCTGEPVLLDWDENDRCRFVISFDIQRH